MNSLAMSDPLYALLQPNIAGNEKAASSGPTSPQIERYLSRLLSLKPSDLTSTEPQSLQQSSHSSLLSIQALSSRSYRTTTASSDHLTNLHEDLPSLTNAASELRTTIPQLDESAVNFATTYSRARDAVKDGKTSRSNAAPSINPISQRKESILLSAQADKLQDILELPSLLSTAIASASGSTTGTSTANYSQTLDLYTHVKRLKVLYPDSQLIDSIQPRAEAAMHEMTTNLLTSLRTQNIRLAAAIRTIGWLRRIVPELGPINATSSTITATSKQSFAPTRLADEQSEHSYGALFLVARLTTFLSMTEDALAPLRDLADQETEKRMQQAPIDQVTHLKPMAPTRRPSHSYSSITGQQTERYLKRYIEIFREQSFSTIQMYTNIFPSSVSMSDDKDQEDLLRLPSALASYPLHLVSLLTETLRSYLPNITDATARESLLVQVLYAAASLGRLGADFSMIIGLVGLEKLGRAEGEGDEGEKEPEWYRIIRKHKVQAARLDAMASGVERRTGSEVGAKA